MGGSKNIRIIQSFLLEIISNKKNSQSKSLTRNVLIVFYPKFIYEIFLLRYLVISIKSKYRNSTITISLPSKFREVAKFILINKLFGLENSDKIISYFELLLNKEKNDLILLPCVDSFYFLPHAIVAIKKASKKIGVSKINDLENPFKKIFSESYPTDKKNYPDLYLGEQLCTQCNISLQPGYENLSNKKKLNYILICNEPEENNSKLSDKFILNFAKQFSVNSSTQIKIIDKNISPTHENIEVIKDVNINKLFELINKAYLVITSDILAMQLCSECNTNLLALFGSKNGYNFLPPGNNVNFIQSRSGILDEISASDVLKSVNENFGLVK